MEERVRTRCTTNTTSIVMVASGGEIRTRWRRVIVSDFLMLRSGYELIPREKAFQSEKERVREERRRQREVEDMGEAGRRGG
jgi:hypothetical protein